MGSGEWEKECGFRREFKKALSIFSRLRGCGFTERLFFKDFAPTGGLWDPSDLGLVKNQTLPALNYQRWGWQGLVASDPD